jgi:DNA-binding SARP family transcriptional activator
MGGARRAGDPALEVRLLGPLEVERRGRVLTIGGPKPRALLTLLALEAGRVVSVDQLVESLWPGEQPGTAAHAVQVYVSQLRKAVGTNAIGTRPPGYVLEVDPGQVDVHRFARLADEGRLGLAAGDAPTAASILREALALWRGAALSDFTYEPFAQTEIARLEELRLVALEGRIDADLVLGRQAELVSELEALADAQPLRERPRAQLMLALYRSGRQADALAAYRSARDALVGQLGIEPGPELKDLEAAILRQDASLLPEQRATGPAMQFRRLATVVVVEAVEWMALAAALDPEALGTVLRRFFDAISTALTRHGGSVEKYAGESVLAVFGVPVSHEDDPLRAARAAIEAQAAVAALAEELELAYGRRIQARIGLESGEVVSTQADAQQRVVIGEAVGIASKLQAVAGAGEIAVGELAARLIDHAAVLHPLGELELVGRDKSLRVFRLLGTESAAPAFSRRLDAPLVGRKRELSALRRSLARAVKDESARAVVVVGPPGVGKSRLVAELAKRAKGVTTLHGRCLSYGEGITFWPLREIVGQSPAGEERDAVLAALDAETPPPVAEVTLLVRALCEALAREEPVVLVLDDVHWAERTLLELVEHVVDHVEGPLLVVCAAREELDAERPGFLAGRENVTRIALDTLSGPDTDKLLAGLGGSVLESDQVERIVEAAEGNPFFVEQLLAHALEGGLAGQDLPASIQALLAARLDRLGPGERAVLERGAVVGKEFRPDDVIALIDASAAPTVDAHVRSLVANGFVRPTDAGDLRFRHVLVQDAVYRSAPKRLRAELHERFVDRFEARGDAGDVDEFAGYHLERAYRLRVELGESDRRVEKLAEDAGRRLGQAGVRAAKRGDLPAARSLLGRATELPPLATPLRGELLCELGIVLNGSGEAGKASDTLERALRESASAGDRRIELRARLELEYVRLPRAPGASAQALLDAASDAIPVFEAAGDDRCLGRALFLAGWIHGGRFGRHQIREEAAERALVHYRRSTWPTTTCLGELANALYYGPTPVRAAVARCEALLETDDPSALGRANLEVFLGGLTAQRGDFDLARALVGSARASFDALGQRASAAVLGGAILGDIELLAGDAAAAEETLRWVCDELERTLALSHLASRAGDLAEALYRQGRFDESAEWVSIAATHSASDDVDARTLWVPVQAKLAAQRAELDEAVALATTAVELVETTDATNRRAAVHADQGEVLRLAGRVGEARASFERALELFEQKGNVAGAARVRERRDDPALV